jgi:large subunit ribosomal protein L35
MPKLKTNKIAYKKFRVGGTGRVKRAQAFTSHNTAKKSRKRIRNLRQRKDVDGANVSALEKMLPFA